MILPKSFEIMPNNHSRAFNTYMSYLRKENYIKIDYIQKSFNYRENRTYKKTARISLLNDNKYKIVIDKTKTKVYGFEKEKDNKYKLEFDKVEDYEKGPHHKQELLRQSMSRTKKMIREYGYSNKWQYFVTLTFDRKRYDSSDYEVLNKKVRKWLMNYKNRKCKNLKYMIIPELHKDQKHYHFHGVFSNINNVVDFRLSKKGTMRYNWIDWDKKFGFTSLEKIRDNDRTISYITKYITKEMTSKFGKQRYYKSNNLEKSILISEVETIKIPKDIELFENDFCYSGYITAEEFHKINEYNGGVLLT